jgi:hypothetical protein
MIVQNAVICNKCDDFIFSKHRHDFVECKCGNIFVDGGQEYLRRGGHGLTDRSYTDLSWSIETEIYNECATVVEEALATGRNKYGIANAVLRALRGRDRVIAEGEQRIMAYNDVMKEVMVVEPDGTVNRYKKVEE